MTTTPVATAPAETRSDQGGPGVAADARPWAAHPLLAAGVKVVVVAVPALGATTFAWAIARTVSRPSGFVPSVAWWAAMLAIGTAGYVLLEHFARRLLPLAALLRLSLVFPDRTPSRYRLALRAGTTRHLRAMVDRAQAGEIGDTAAEAAETVLVLTAALNRHDRLTRGHSERVRAYTEVIAQELDLDEGACQRLRWAALLHDIGKLAVPSAILNKSGSLTAEEYELVKIHPAEGERLIAPLVEWLGDAAGAVGQHHERFDGTGYPCGLAGQEISLAGRIVAVADTFDVITSSRSYKKAISPSAARAEIERCSSTQFDPLVTRALLSVSIGKLWLAGGPLTWCASLPLLSQIPTAGTAFPPLAGAGTAMASLLPTFGGMAAATAAAVVMFSGVAIAAELPATDDSGQLVGAGAATTAQGTTVGSADDSSGARDGTIGSSNGNDKTATGEGSEDDSGSNNATGATGASANGSAAPGAGADPSTSSGSDRSTTSTDVATGTGSGTIAGAVRGVTGTVNGVAQESPAPSPPAPALPVVGPIVDLPTGGSIPVVTAPVVTVPLVTIPPATLPVLGG